MENNYIMLLELVMIVKNSGTEIIRTLTAINPYIDHWTILDTGSTDGTPERIRTLLSSIPGTLYEEPFVDFSTSRNRVLDLAGERCKFCIMLDDTYELKGGKELRNILSKTKDDAFEVLIASGMDKYYSIRVTRTSKRFRYKYLVHEVYDISSTPRQPTNIPLLPESIYVEDEQTDTMGKRSTARFKHDYDCLKKDLKRYPKDTRVVFYMARTCEKLGNTEEARTYYMKRIEMATELDEETFESNLALIVEDSKRNKITQEKIDNFLKVYPHRTESNYYKASFHYRKGDMKTAYKYAVNTISIKLCPKDVLFYREKLIQLDAYVLAIDLHFHTGRFEQGEKLLKERLKLFPNSIALNNIRHTVSTSSTEPKSLGLGGKKVVVIHTGDKSFIQWDPSDTTNEKSYASGSEIMAKNVAEEMVRQGIRTFVFGNFPFDKKTIQGVEYYTSDLFVQFSERYIIDTLIVSRSIDLIYYSPGVKNVYLWVHDITPFMTGMGFQMHKKKFRKILCLCNWHKQHVTKELQIDPEIIHVTRNAIDPERFKYCSKEKVPLRFIYSSGPNRGLTRLLTLFPKIKEKYPSAELYVFCNKNQLEEKQEELLQTPGVFHLPRQSQEQIAKEYMKADIWFYPTDFEETYCITAVEAQAAGLLCVTTDTGSLPEIVGSRGVIINHLSTDQDMLKKLFFAIDNQQVKHMLTTKATQWARQQDINSLVNDWIKLIF
jgi:glycosyltransferase involved in cell wall biosynthesis